MNNRIFVPVESYCFASPELRMQGKLTDVGLIAEALVLFENCDLNVTNGNNLADVLSSFITSCGTIDPFLELISSGNLRIHFFDFTPAPVLKDGVYTYWNIQDVVAAKSHVNSFEQKVLYHSSVDAILKTRQRQKLYNIVPQTSVIDGSEDYASAIDAALVAASSNEESELLLNAFRKSLPIEYRDLLPKRIALTTSQDPITGRIQHTFNFNFEKLKTLFPNLNLGEHIPGVGLLQTHRVLYASRKHKYDVYLPYPLAEAVLAKMDTVSDRGKKFTRTGVELTRNAGFPDIRTAFNKGALTWKDILEIRAKSALFRKWFAINGGNPAVALT